MKRRRAFDLRAMPRRQQTLALACMLFWSILCYHAVVRFVLMGSVVAGNSMAPTFRHGDRCVIHRWVYHFRRPRRGDVVAIDFPGYPEPSLKRVIALPGEEVSVRPDGVYVDRQPLPEPYLPEGTRTLPTAPMRGGRFEVAPECYFVLGDNRTASLDSRHFGAVRRRQILGYVF